MHHMFPFIRFESATFAFHLAFTCFCVGDKAEIPYMTSLRSEITEAILYLFSPANVGPFLNETTPIFLVSFHVRAFPALFSFSLSLLAISFQRWAHLNYLSCSNLNGI